MRLNKYIARAGVTSRRKADDLIAAGRVHINGDVVTELGTRVETGDVVTVDGEAITPRRKVYLLLNKPENVITTTDDEHGRQTVMDLVRIPKEEKKALFPVGRLDRDSVGALLLTSDGDLAHRLMHPRYEIEKLYLVKTRQPVKPHEIDRLRRGVELEDGPAKADEVVYVQSPNRHEVGMVLHEGRNRQIRRMMAALDHEVEHLERVAYAGLRADSVPRGEWRRLRPSEIEQLRGFVHLT